MCVNAIIRPGLLCIIKIIIASYKKEREKRYFKWVSTTKFITENQPKGQLVSWSEFSNTPSCSKQNITTSGLISFMENLPAMELLEKATSPISDTRKSGTHGHYESAWWNWDSWFNQRCLDSIRCDVNPILELLTELLNQDLEYSVICSYRSAVLQYLLTMILLVPLLLANTHSFANEWLKYIITAYVTKYFVSFEILKKCSIF